MIEHVDGWVRDIVAEGVDNGTEVSVGPIDGAAKAKGLRVTLIGLAENTGARAAGREMVRPSGGEGLAARRERPVTMTLDYAVTALPGDPDASGALGQALTALLLAQHGAPPPSPAMESAGWLSARLLVAQPEHPLVRDPASMWSALGAPLRPAIGVRVDAALNPYQPVFVRLVQEAVVGTTPSSGPRDVEVRTARASVAGQVVDAHTREPLRNVAVDPADGPGATTNEKGIFVLRGVPKGPTVLRARHPSYGEAAAEVEIPSLGEPVPAVRIALPPREPAAGRGRAPRTLRGADGEPEPYRVVRAGVYATVTDAEGRHALPDDA